MAETDIEKEKINLRYFQIESFILISEISADNFDNSNFWSFSSQDENNCTIQKSMLHKSEWKYRKVYQDFVCMAWGQ